MAYLKKTYLLILLLLPMLVQSQQHIGEKVKLKAFKRFEDRCANSGWIRVLRIDTKKRGFVDQYSILKIPFECSFLTPFESCGLALAEKNGSNGFLIKAHRWFFIASTYS